MLPYRNVLLPSLKIAMHRVFKGYHLAIQDTHLLCEQERLATQTGRFKDHTFQKLDRTTQIKVVEVMLDSSIKNRKGVLAYAKNPGTEEVLKLASWWPQEVKYAAPRSMPEEDLCKVFAALIKYADSNDDLLLRRLEASVGCLGVDTMDQLAINAAIKALTRKEEPALDTAENDSGDALLCARNHPSV